MIINIETKKIEYSLHEGDYYDARIKITDKRGISYWFDLIIPCRLRKLYICDSVRTSESVGKSYLKTTKHMAHVPKELVAYLAEFERTRVFGDDRAGHPRCEVSREVSLTTQRNEAILNNPLNKLILKAISFWKRIIK